MGEGQRRGAGRRADSPRVGARCRGPADHRCPRRAHWLDGAGRRAQGLGAGTARRRDVGRRGRLELLVRGVELRRRPWAPPDVGQVVLAIDPTATMGDGFVDRIEVELQALSAEPGARLPATAGWNTVRPRRPRGRGARRPDGGPPPRTGTARSTTPSSSGRSWQRRPGYLDTATYGLPPRPTVERAHRVIDEWDAGTRTGARGTTRPTRPATSFAALIGVPADSVAVGPATSA